MSQINTVWEVNGHSFELDLQDVEVAERYEEAFDKMSEEEKAMPKDGKTSERIRAYYQLFVNVFDRIFGDGSGIKILGEKANTRICNERYSEFLQFVADQTADVRRQSNDLVSKYSPNRAQRRASAKKKPV